MNKKSPPRIYWDTTMWSEWYRNQAGVGDLCEQLLAHAEAGRIVIVISP